MSDTPPPIPSPPRPPEQRNGCVTALMIVGGIIMLLPGLCALLVGVIAIAGRSFPSDLISLIVVGLLVGFAGVMLIRHATRGPQS